MPYLRRLFDHMRWADERVLELLRSVDVDPEAKAEIARLLSHVVAAERIWLDRATGAVALNLPVWPEWSAEEIAVAAAAVQVSYAQYLAGITADDLGRVVEYGNSQGVTFRTRLCDILVHVAMHGSYHRGQIAASVRRSGRAPMNTDFITYVRELGDA